MIRHSFTIDASNIEPAKAHIRQQFANLSWWPTEDPTTAKAEFEAMQSSPEQLTEWCHRWLYGGEWRQLENAVARRIAEAGQAAPPSPETLRRET
ncbi:hypothetical protein [Methylomagnum sp.]